jgi:diacylglycerol O-acyltransferase
VEDPAESFGVVHDAMARLKDSGQAVGARVLTDLSGFAPPTIMSQAARLQARQRFFNLVVTNVPGPQFPLYLMGRELRALHPQVPLAQRQVLGIAIMSYNGRLDFGLLGDFDAMPDLETMAADLEAAIAELSLAAGVEAPADEHDGRPVLGFEMPRERGGARTRPVRPRAGG